MKNIVIVLPRPAAPPSARAPSPKRTFDLTEQHPTSRALGAASCPVPGRSLPNPASTSSKPAPDQEWLRDVPALLSGGRFRQAEGGRSHTTRLNGFFLPGARTERGNGLDELSKLPDQLTKICHEVHGR